MIKEEDNEFPFFESAFKVVRHDSSEIEAKIQIFTKCDTNFRR